MPCYDNYDACCSYERDVARMEKIEETWEWGCEDDTVREDFESYAEHRSNNSI